MARGAIQFQQGLSLPEFQRLTAPRSNMEPRGFCAAIAALEKARWPDGSRCPRCNGHAHGLVYGRRLKRYRCRHCGHQATLEAGTIMQASKWPLSTWFLAFDLIGQTKTGSPHWSPAATWASTMTRPDCCTTRFCERWLIGRGPTCCGERSKSITPTSAETCRAARQVGERRTRSPSSRPFP